MGGDEPCAFVWSTFRQKGVECGWVQIEGKAIDWRKTLRHVTIISNSPRSRFDKLPSLRFDRKYPKAEGWSTCVWISLSGWMGSREIPLNIYFLFSAEIRIQWIVTISWLCQINQEETVRRKLRNSLEAFPMPSAAQRKRFHGPARKKEKYFFRDILKPFCFRSKTENPSHTGDDKHQLATNNVSGWNVGMKKKPKKPFQQHFICHSIYNVDSVRLDCPVGPDSGFNQIYCSPLSHWFFFRLNNNERYRKRCLDKFPAMKCSIGGCFDANLHKQNLLE